MHTGHAKLEQLCSTQSHKGVAQSGSNTSKLRLSRVTVIHAAEDAHLKGLTQKTKRDPKGQMQRRRGLSRVRNQLLFRSVQLCFESCYVNGEALHSLRHLSR